MKRIYTMIVATLMAIVVTTAPALAYGVGAGERPLSNSVETAMAVGRKEPPHSVRRVQKSDRPKFLGNAWEVTQKGEGGFPKGGLGKS